MDINRSGSQPSAQGSPDYFTGSVRVAPLIKTTEPARVGGAVVTFEPGARTAWHTHPLGQMLIVTAACGVRSRNGARRRGTSSLPLVPIMVVVLSGFLVTGLAMPVLPLHVHEGLGLGEFVVGIVAGAQFGAALITRFWAGNFSDRRGAKYAVVVGQLLAAAAGLLY